MIASGQIRTRPEWFNKGVKFGRIVEGLFVGIPTGIAKQAVDSVVGVWDMIKSIFSGEILDQLVALYEAPSNMNTDMLLELLFDNGFTTSMLITHIM